MKMYVGNLFSPFGEVLSSLIITDQHTRQSKNMGYVEMAVREEGKKAIRKLNGKEINNRCLVVRKA
jgi:RNA recognition motif-containing protein